MRGMGCFEFDPIPKQTSLVLSFWTCLISNNSLWLRRSLGMLPCEARFRAQRGDEKTLQENVAQMIHNPTMLVASAI
eukprot:4882082-Amphidinium_carterae.1